AGGRPLEHLEVAVGVADGCQRAPADDLVDAHGLARSIVDELDLGKAHKRGLAFPPLISHFDPAADDLFGRYSVRSLDPRPHELDSAPRYNVGLEAVRSEVGEYLEHRLINQISIGTVEPRMSRFVRPVPDDGLEFVGRHSRVAGSDDLQPIAGATSQ